MFEILSAGLSAHVWTVTLNCPDQLNLFNAKMMKELIGAFDRDRMPR